MTDDEISAAITDYEDKLGIPATDALTRSPDHFSEYGSFGFPGA